MGASDAPLEWGVKRPVTLQLCEGFRKSLALVVSVVIFLLYIVDFVIFSSYALGSGGISISMRGINRSSKLRHCMWCVYCFPVDSDCRDNELISYRASFHLSVWEYSSQHRNYTKPALTMPPCDPWAGTCNGWGTGRSLPEQLQNLTRPSSGGHDPNQRSWDSTKTCKRHPRTQGSSGRGGGGGATNARGQLITRMHERNETKRFRHWTHTTSSDNYMCNYMNI